MNGMSETRMSFESRAGKGKNAIFLHEGWPEWFSNLGDKLVERGSPMADGLALRGDGSTGSIAHLNGYSVIQAGDLDQVLRLVRLHSHLMLGDEHFARVTRPIRNREAPLTQPHIA
jgi:hypothetical protein